MSEITYDDKIDLNVESTIANINKVTASDMNEIKSVVNGNAETLDDINIPSNWVSVGDTIPTDGRKVLFKASKNLFNQTSQIVGSGINTGTGLIYTNSAWTISSMIKVSPSSTITLSANSSSGQLAIYQYSNGEITTQNYITYNQTNLNTTSSLSVTLNNATNYVVIGYRNDKGLNNIQLELGSSATTYEPYIEQDLIVNGGKFIADQLVNVGATNSNDGRRVWFSKSKNDFNMDGKYSDLTLTAQGNATTTKTANKITITTASNNNSGFSIVGATLSTYIDNLDTTKDYYISMDVKANRTLTLGMGVVSRPTYSIGTTTQRIQTKTTINGTTGMVVWSTSQTANDTIEISNIMITQNSNAEFEPYVQQGIYVDNELLYQVPKVLWTNPNPTSSFANQEITLNDNITNYKYYEIITNLTTSYATMVFSTGWLPTSYNQTRLSVPRQYLGNRSVSINQNKITFGHYEQYTTYGQTTASNNDGTCIPLLVLGYK